MDNIDFNTWFDNLSEDEQKAYVEDMEADAQIMLDKSNFY